jgi:hypothetical protein
VYVGYLSSDYDWLQFWLACKYDISYYGVVLGVGICIVVQDTYAILVKYLAREKGKRKKNDKSVVCVVSCKKLISTTMILPTANMRITYEGIGIYVDD